MNTVDYSHQKEGINYGYMQEYAWISKALQVKYIYCISYDCISKILFSTFCKKPRLYKQKSTQYMRIAKGKER
jgi:hypothetical protein